MRIARLLIPVLVLLASTACRETSSPVLLPNSNPTIALLLPEPNVDGDPLPLDGDGSLMFRAAVQDSEDLAEELRITWTAVDTDVGDGEEADLGETTPDSSGQSDFVVAGLEAGSWLIVATVTDSEGASDEASMPIVVIATNEPPEVELITPSEGDVYVEGDVVTFSAVVADDRGNDQLDVEWFDDLDGVLSTAAPSSAGLLTFSSTTLIVGQHLVTLTVTDGAGEQAQAQVGFSIISGNLPPSTPEVDVQPDEPSTGEDLTCIVTVASTDPEGEPVSLLYTWYVDGTPTAWVDPILTADQTGSGETWTCEVVGDDGVLQSEVGSDSVLVLGSAPEITGATLGPAPAYEPSTLTCAAEGWSDPDGDPEDYLFAWLVNSSPILPTGATLSGADFDRDDIVQCEVAPTDGSFVGLAVLSNAVLIENSTPTIPGVLVSPSPAASVGQSLLCTPSGGSDDDPGDLVSYVISWLLNGGPAPTYDGLDTVPATATELGDEWTCVVAATDGTATSATASASTTVLPAVGDVVVSEYMPTPAAVSDAAGEWLELYNASGAALDLDGFELFDDDGDSHVIAGPLIVPAAGRLVLGRNADFGSNGGVAVDYEYSGFSMDEVDEIVVAFGALEIDRVDYDWTGGLDGHSSSLDPALGLPSAFVNDSPSSWCGSSIPLGSPGADFGTPGTINDSCSCWDSDGDGDGYGDDATCGWFDCNDANPGINPEAYDVCENGVDEDCTGTDAQCDCLSTDGDGDGYGTGAACSPIDCDDVDSNVNPGAAEACNGTDDDCDGSIDEGFDSDGDGWTTCEGDCNDGDGSVYPGALETCDDADEDCDGTVDEGFDNDGDGWTTCGGDCNDGSSAIHPGATDTCNGVDNDCDGVTDEDAAGDGYENNNTSSVAPTISTNNTAVTIYATFQAASDIDDWYAVSATDDTNVICDEFYVDASLSSIPAGTDYDLYLYDEGLNLLDWSENLSNNDEAVNYTPGCFSWGDDGGTFYVRVRRWSGWSCSDTYRLDTSNDD